MWFLYAQWRYRGQDPFAAVHGDRGSPGFRYESLLAAFAVYSARIEEIGVKGLGA